MASESSSIGSLFEKLNGAFCLERVVGKVAGPIRTSKKGHRWFFLSDKRTKMLCRLDKRFADQEITVGLVVAMSGRAFVGTNGMIHFEVRSVSCPAELAATAETSTKPGER